MREEYAPLATEDDTNHSMAESAREADIKTAVIREKARAGKSGMRLSDNEALQNVYNRIDVNGIDAVCPNFARIANRIRGLEYEGDSIPRRPRTYQSS